MVQISDFRRRFSTDDLLAKVFSSDELKNSKQAENLAAIFAAKEAFFKAVGRKADWLDVWVEKSQTGEPELKSVLLNGGRAQVSLSHSGDYATAVVIID